MNRSKHIKLAINTPCHEKQENMDKNSLGFFCHSCTKQVVDFTHMSDDQIVAYFRNRDEKVCGRFLPAQLKSYALPVAAKQASMRSSLVIGSFISIATALSMGLSVSPVMAQGVHNERYVDPDEHYFMKGEVVARTTDSLKVLKGKVVDAHNEEAVAYAVVRIKDTKIRTSATKRGTFELEIPADLANMDELTVVVQAENYEPTEIKLSSNELDQDLVFRLEQFRQELMGDVIWIEDRPAR